VSHRAGPVSGLDDVAFAGEFGQLDLLDVFPVRRLDRDRESTHSPMIAACMPYPPAPVYSRLDEGPREGRDGRRDEHDHDQRRPKEER
jgi:hypothetical protein